MSQTNVYSTESLYPLGTVTVIAVCAAIQLYVFLFNPPMNEFTLNALLVIYGRQYWRIRRPDISNAIRFAGNSMPGPDGIPYRAWRALGAPRGKSTERPTSRTRAEL